MSPDKRKAIKEKRKHGRKGSKNTKTPSSVMADKQDGDEVSSPKESGDDDLTIAKRVKRAKATKNQPPTSQFAIANYEPVSPVLANEERRDGLEEDSADDFAYPEITLAEPELKDTKTTRQPNEWSDRIQSQLVFAVNDPRFWQAEYRKLEEIHGRYHDETSKELASLREKLANNEYEDENKMWYRFHYRKHGYSRDLGYRVFSKEAEWEYGSISRAARNICHELGKQNIPPTLLTASKDPEYGSIAGECSHSWLEQLLREQVCEEGCVPISFWIAERVITKYVLRCIFEPMLVGLDKEVESLLLRVRASMESRMVPAMADKWMGETLRSYTLLPKYDQDRDYYLRSHTEYLRGFLEHFFPILEDNTGRDLSAKYEREKIPEHIMTPLADLAAEMSFSYLRYEIGWDYCEKTTVILRKDLENHEVFHFNGWRLSDRFFRKVGLEEKIGDVALFVRPPVFEVDRTAGTRVIHGAPLVIVRPVSSFDPDAEIYA